MKRPGPNNLVSRRVGAISLVCIGLMAASGWGQTDTSFEEAQQYVRGLVQLDLPEVLERYLSQVEREDPIAAGELRIEAERARRQDPKATPARRDAALDRLLQTRRRLIEDHPRERRRVVWRLDQASDLFFDQLAIDAAGLTALYGNPSPLQRQRVAGVAREMHDMAMAAEIEIDTAILALEDDPRFGSDVALQAQRRSMVENERDARLPFFRGVGAFLHATLNETDPDPRSKTFEIATERLVPLADRLEGDLASKTRLYAALALGRVGAFGESENQLKLVIEDPAALPADVFGAHMGRVLNVVDRRGAEAGLGALDELANLFLAPGDLFFRILLADQRFLLLSRLGEMDDSITPERIFGAYLDLLSKETAIDADQLHAIVIARLTHATDDDTPLALLPPLVTLARAGHLIGGAGRGGAGNRAEEAVTLLEELLARPRLAPLDRARALFELGRALHVAGRSLEAVARFTELARRHSTDTHAEPAIELAAAIAEAAHREDPHDTSIRRSLRDVLGVLLAGYANLPSVDRWRYAAGRLALTELQFDEAMRFFGQISPDADRWLDGLFMQATTARGRARNVNDSNGAAQLHRDALVIVNQVRPGLHAGRDRAPDDARRDALRFYVDMLDVIEAEANMGLGQFEAAISALDRLVADASTGDGVLAEALKVRISAYQSGGRPEDAQAEIARFIAAAPEQVRRIMSPMLAKMQAEVLALLEESRDQDAISLARNSLLPIAISLEQWSQAHPGAADLELRVRIADSLRLSGQHQDARRLYEQLLRQSPSALQLLFGRAECLFAARGDSLAEAMTIYRRLAATGPGGASAGRRYYWQCQLRMLEILDLTGRNTDKIVPRIRRLRQDDPELGGERTRRGFQRLQNKYGS